MKDQVLNNRDYAASDIMPYQTDTTDDTVIIDRWESGTGVVLLRKTTIAGAIITRELAKDTWANRATATYTPLHD